MKVSAAGTGEAPDGTSTLNLIVVVAPSGAGVLRSTIRNAVDEGVAQQVS